MPIELLPTLHESIDESADSDVSLEELQSFLLEQAELQQRVTEIAENKETTEIDESDNIIEKRKVLRENQRITRQNEKNDLARREREMIQVQLQSLKEQIDPDSPQSMTNAKVREKLGKELSEEESEELSMYQDIKDEIKSLVILDNADLNSLDLDSDSRQKYNGLLNGLKEVFGIDDVISRLINSSVTYSCNDLETLYQELYLNDNEKLQDLFLTTVYGKVRSNRNNSKNNMLVLANFINSKVDAEDQESLLLKVSEVGESEQTRDEFLSQMQATRELDKLLIEKKLKRNDITIGNMFYENDVYVIEFSTNTESNSKNLKVTQEGDVYEKSDGKWVPCDISGDIEGIDGLEEEQRQRISELMEEVDIAPTLQEALEEIGTNINSYYIDGFTEEQTSFPEIAFINPKFNSKLDQSQKEVLEKWLEIMFEDNETMVDGVVKNDEKFGQYVWMILFTSRKELLEGEKDDKEDDKDLFYLEAKRFDVEEDGTTISKEFVGQIADAEFDKLDQDQQLKVMELFLGEYQKIVISGRRFEEQLGGDTIKQFRDASVDYVKTENETDPEKQYQRIKKFEQAKKDLYIKLRIEIIINKRNAKEILQKPTSFKIKRHIFDPEARNWSEKAKPTTVSLPAEPFLNADDIAKIKEIFAGSGDMESKNQQLQMYLQNNDGEKVVENMLNWANEQFSDMVAFCTKLHQGKANAQDHIEHAVLTYAFSYYLQIINTWNNEILQSASAEYGVDRNTNSLEFEHYAKGYADYVRAQRQSFVDENYNKSEYSFLYQTDEEKKAEVFGQKVDEVMQGAGKFGQKMEEVEQLIFKFDPNITPEEKKEIIDKAKTKYEEYQKAVESVEIPDMPENVKTMLEGLSTIDENTTEDELIERFGEIKADEFMNYLGEIETYQTAIANINFPKKAQQYMYYVMGMQEVGVKTLGPARQQKLQLAQSYGQKINECNTLSKQELADKMGGLRGQIVEEYLAQQCTTFVDNKYVQVPEGDQENIKEEVIYANPLSFKGNENYTKAYNKYLSMVGQSTYTDYASMSYLQHYIHEDVTWDSNVFPGLYQENIEDLAFQVNVNMVYAMSPGLEVPIGAANGLSDSVIGTIIRLGYLLYDLGYAGLAWTGAIESKSDVQRSRELEGLQNILSGIQMPLSTDAQKPLTDEINADNLGYAVGNGIAQMLLLLSGAKTISTGLKGASLLGLSSRSVGLITMSSLLMMPKSYQEGVGAGLGSGEAFLYAFIQGGVGSGLELISPNKFFFKEGKEQIAKMTFKLFFKNMLKESGEEILQENSQEIASILINSLTNNIANTKMKDTYTRDDFIATSLVTALVTSKVYGGTTALNLANNQKNITEEALTTALYQKLTSMLGSNTTTLSSQQIMIDIVNTSMDGITNKQSEGYKNLEALLNLLEENETPETTDYSSLTTIDEVTEHFDSFDQRDDLNFQKKLQIINQIHKQKGNQGEPSINQIATIYTEIVNAFIVEETGMLSQRAYQSELLFAYNLANNNTDGFEAITPQSANSEQWKAFTLWTITNSNAKVDTQGDGPFRPTELYNIDTDQEGSFVAKLTTNREAVFAIHQNTDNKNYIGKYRAMKNLGFTQEEIKFLMDMGLSGEVFREPTQRGRVMEQIKGDWMNNISSLYTVLQINDKSLAENFFSDSNNFFEKIRTFDEIYGADYRTWREGNETTEIEKTYINKLDEWVNDFKNKYESIKTTEELLNNQQVFEDLQQMVTFLKEMGSITIENLITDESILKDFPQITIGVTFEQQKEEVDNFLERLAQDQNLKNTYIHDQANINAIKKNLKENLTETKFLQLQEKTGLTLVEIVQNSLLQRSSRETQVASIFTSSGLDLTDADKNILRQIHTNTKGQALFGLDQSAILLKARAFEEHFITPLQQQYQQETDKTKKQTLEQKINNYREVRRKLLDSGYLGILSSKEVQESEEFAKNSLRKIKTLTLDLAVVVQARQTEKEKSSPDQATLTKYENLMETIFRKIRDEGTNTQDNNSSYGALIPGLIHDINNKLAHKDESGVPGYLQQLMSIIDVENIGQHNHIGSSELQSIVAILNLPNKDVLKNELANTSGVEFNKTSLALILGEMRRNSYKYSNNDTGRKFAIDSNNATLTFAISNIKGKRSAKTTGFGFAWITQTLEEYNKGKSDGQEATLVIEYSYVESGTTKTGTITQNYSDELKKLPDGAKITTQLTLPQSTTTTTTAKTDTSTFTKTIEELLSEYNLNTTETVAQDLDRKETLKTTLANKTIHIVDDDRMKAMMTRIALQNFGADPKNITMTIVGDDTQIDNIGLDQDVIITDVNMTADITGEAIATKAKDSGGKVFVNSTDGIGNLPQVDFVSGKNEAQKTLYDGLQEELELHSNTDETALLQNMQTQQDRVSNLDNETKWIDIGVVFVGQNKSLTIEQGGLSDGQTIGFVNHAGKFVALNHDTYTAINEGVKHFLQTNGNLAQSDCHEFAMAVAEKTGYKYDSNNLTQENLEDVNEENLPQTGQPVVFYNDNNTNEPTHSAIYIGEGKYLSKLGEGGDVVFTDLQTLKSLYGETVKKVPAVSHNIEELIGSYKAKENKKQAIETELANFDQTYSDTDLAFQIGRLEYMYAEAVELKDEPLQNQIFAKILEINPLETELTYNMLENMSAYTTFQNTIQDIAPDSNVSKDLFFLGRLTFGNQEFFVDVINRDDNSQPFVLEYKNKENTVMLSVPVLKNDDGSYQIDAEVDNSIDNNVLSSIEQFFHNFNETYQNPDNIISHIGVEKNTLDQADFLQFAQMLPLNPSVVVNQDGSITIEAETYKITIPTRNNTSLRTREISGDFNVAGIAIQGSLDQDSKNFIRKKLLEYIIKTRYTDNQVYETDKAALDELLSNYEGDTESQIQILQHIASKQSFPLYSEREMQEIFGSEVNTSTFNVTISTILNNTKLSFVQRRNKIREVLSKTSINPNKITNELLNSLLLIHNAYFTHVFQKSPKEIRNIYLETYALIQDRKIVNYLIRSGLLGSSKNNKQKELKEQQESKEQQNDPKTTEGFIRECDPSDFKTWENSKDIFNPDTYQLHIPYSVYDKLYKIYGEGASNSKQISYEGGLRKELRKAIWEKITTNNHFKEEGNGIYSLQVGENTFEFQNKNNQGIRVRKQARRGENKNSRIDYSIDHIMEVDLLDPTQPGQTEMLERALNVANFCLAPNILIGSGKDRAINDYLNRMKKFHNKKVPKPTDMDNFYFVGQGPDGVDGIFCYKGNVLKKVSGTVKKIEGKLYIETIEDGDFSVDLSNATTSIPFYYNHRSSQSFNQHIQEKPNKEQTFLEKHGLKSERLPSNRPENPTQEEITNEQERQRIIEEKITNLEEPEATEEQKEELRNKERIPQTVYTGLQNITLEAAQDDKNEDIDDILINEAARQESIKRIEVEIKSVVASKELKKRFIANNEKITESENGNLLYSGKNFITIYDERRASTKSQPKAILDPTFPKTITADKLKEIQEMINSIYRE